MSSPARTAGAPATPEGAQLHGEVSSEPRVQISKTVRSSRDGNRLFDSQVAANSGKLEGWQHEEPDQQTAQDPGGPVDGRENNTLGRGRRSSKTWTASCGSSQRPRVCSYSVRANTGSPKQEPQPCEQTFDFLESRRLVSTTHLVEQRQSTSEALGEMLRSPSSQPVCVTEGVPRTDTTMGSEAVTAENENTTGEAVALKSSIPSVLITSPSLGRISVLCPPVAPHSAQAAYMAGRSSTNVWTSQAHSEEAANTPPLAAPEVEGERYSTAHVIAAPSPSVAPPPSVTSSNGGGSRFRVGNTSFERDLRTGEDGIRRDKEARGPETGYPVECDRQIQPNEITDYVTSCDDRVRPSKTEVTRRQHSDREVYQGASSSADDDELETVSMTGDRRVENTEGFRCQHLLEHTSASHTYSSRSSSPVTAGRSGNYNKRRRRSYAGKSPRDYLQFVLPPCGARGSENGNISQEEAGGRDTRRRFSLPAEGALSDAIHSRGVVVAPSVSSFTQGVSARGEGFQWSERSVWRHHESRVKDGAAKNRRQSIDLVHNHREHTDLRLLRQPLPSENAEKEERTAVPAGERGTAAAAAAVPPREGFLPGGLFRGTRGGADDSLNPDRSAACSERKNTRRWARMFEERDQRASRDQLGAPVVPRSAAVCEQGMTHLQQPLLSTAFRAAARAAAAAARTRMSATTSGGRKTVFGGAGGRSLPNVAAELGSVTVARGARASSRDTSPPFHLKQATPSVAELAALGATAEGCTQEVTSEQQLGRREADRALGTSSGISVASSDQSSATRASAERQQREQLLRRAEQRRVVAELAALSACVAAACVKRAALCPLQRLILNTLQHWREKLESVPQERRRGDSLEAHHREQPQRPPQEVLETGTAQRVSEAGTALRAIFEQKGSTCVRCAEPQPATQTDFSSVNTVQGCNCMSVPLSELLRGSMPPCSEAAAPRGCFNLGTSPKETGATTCAQQDGSRTSDLNCLRVTLFASKQVLRWRHLRQRVTVFTEKTSPYYFWPPWGGFRLSVKAGGSALPSKLLMTGEMDGTDSGVGRPKSARQIALQRNAGGGERAETGGGIHGCGPLPQKAGKGGELSCFESGTPASKGKKRLLDELEQVSEGNIDDKRSPVNRVKLAVAARACVVDSESTYGTPTKSRPDFVDAEIQRDTTATPSSPPALGEGSHRFSAASASVQQQPLHRRSEHSGNRGHQGASYSSSVSVAKDALYPCPYHAAASSTHPRESRCIPHGQDKRINICDLRCASGVVAAPGTGDTVGSNNEDICVSKGEQASNQGNSELCRVCAKDAMSNERLSLFNYKDKHAVVPFLPNVLAPRWATRACTYRASSPPGPLRLPFEEAGTVYVLRAESVDSCSSNSREESEMQLNCQLGGHAADNPDTKEIDCTAGLSEARNRDIHCEGRNTCSSRRQDISLSPASAEEEIYTSLEPSNRRGMQRNVSVPAGNIVAVWACTDTFTAPTEKTEAATLKSGSCSSKYPACGNPMQKRFWLCTDALGGLLRGGKTDNHTTVGDTATEENPRLKEALQRDTDAYAVRARRSSVLLENTFEPEIKAALPDASCNPQHREHYECLCREAHQKKAEEVTKAMQMWCQAMSGSGVDRDTPENGRPHNAACSLQEITFESFASAYNDLAEKAVKELLTQIRTRGEHALRPTACPLLEENTGIASRRRREDARCLQQQLRTKLQQLVQNYNRLVTAEQSSADQNSGPDGAQVDASQSSDLEQEFQDRLRDLQQRVEYHLDEHRQLAGSLKHHSPRQPSRRRGLCLGAQQVSGARGAPRRGLQWYSVGIRWLRTRAALEYFVVRHRRRDVGRAQLHAWLGDFAGGHRRMQRINQENVDGKDGQPSCARLSGGTGFPPSSNGTSPDTSGAACASGRSSMCVDEKNRGAFYFPAVPPVGPVGMSPVTVSEASSPPTPGSPPVSSSEDGVSAVSPKGSFWQRGSGAHAGTRNHTNSVLLLHELLQPMRLDAGGIRAALVLVVLRLRRFIRVVRKKKHADSKKQNITTCKSNISRERVGKAQRIRGRVDRDVRGDVPSADDSKASQESAPMRARSLTSDREGMSLRTHLPQLTRLQDDFTELPTSGSKRPFHNTESAEYTSACDEAAGGRVPQRLADPRSSPNSKFVEAALAEAPWTDTVLPSTSHLRVRTEEPTGVEDTLHGESHSVCPMQRQFPWSSIRVALVVPNLGVQLQQILPSARSVGGGTNMQGAKDAVVDRDTAESVRTGMHSRYSVCGRDALPRRGGESFATLSQTSQQLDSGSQSPAPRRLGVSGVIGAGDAAEARAARAAARAAAAETRICKQREREEAETRGGGLSDHAAYSGEGRGERSRPRSSPERSNRKADAVSGSAGDEEEDDTSGELRSATNSGASSRMCGTDGVAGKHGEMEHQSGHLGLTRTPPQVPQRVRRSWGVPSASRGDVTVKKRPVGLGSDEEPYAADSADTSWETRARSIATGNEGGEGNQLTAVKGGALEPFWWRACCARFHETVQSPSEERKRREQSVKTVCSCGAKVDESRPSVDPGNGGGAVRSWDMKGVCSSEGKERNSVTSGSARHLCPCGGEASECSYGQENVKSTRRLHGDLGASCSSHGHTASVEHTVHMVSSCPSRPASSSSELTSSDEESGSDRGASTTSESSMWSKSSSSSSDVSVEASTVLRQQSTRQVAADRSCWASVGELPLAGRLPPETCSAGTDEVPQGSVLKTVETDVGNGACTLAPEPAEPSAEVESVSSTTPAALERGQDVMEHSDSARFPALSRTSAKGGIAASYSVGSLPRSSVDNRSPTTGTESVSKCPASLVAADEPKLQSPGARERRDSAENNPLVSDQVVSSAAPHLIVMPREESVSADVRTMLPQLRIRFATCAVDLTSKEEREVLQINGRTDHIALRPRRSIRRLWNALHPILHTLQMFNRKEEGRGGWISGKSSWDLNAAGKGLVDASDTDGSQGSHSTETTADVVCSALLAAATDLVRDPSFPDSTGNSGLFRDQISEENTAISRLADALTRTHGRQSRVGISFPRQVSTLTSQRMHTGEGVTARTKDTKQIEKLKTLIADGILYLSGVLDVETAQVGAAQESVGDDALLSLLRFPSAPGNAGAVSQPLADRDEASEHDIRARFHAERACAEVDSSPREAGTEGKWSKKKRMKTEAGTRSFSTDTPGGGLRTVKTPTSSHARKDHWEESDFPERLFDFGPKTPSADTVTPKIILRCPRAFGRTVGGRRRPRLPGARSGLQGDAASAFGTKGDLGAEATWEDFSPKELRRALRFPGSGDEGIARRGWESRGRTPAFLRPDGWEALDDESPSSSSAEMTSAYGPVSSGSESVYLSVPSSPRRRRQQRQLRWRSRHLAVGASGAYHFTSAELGGDYIQESLEKSFLDSPKRAYGGRGSRRAAVGSVFRVFQSSSSSTGGTAVLQASTSSQSFSPPLTRGAAATMPRNSSIYTSAEALSAGQEDAATQSECTTRERRRPTQQDRLFSRYLPEKLSKRQFAAASSSQARRKSSVGRMQRNRAASVSATPLLEWSAPECSLTASSRKKMSSGSGGASQSTPKSHSSRGGTRHQLVSAEGASIASSAGTFARTTTTAAVRGSNLDSPRETPRPGRRTPTAGSPVPTGVYFDASRKLWRCQWRENGRFKTKGFSLNTYGTLKDARKACIMYRCLMGGWEVDPRWLADNDSQDSGDNGLSEGHPLDDEDSVNQSRAPGADGSQSEVDQGEVGDVAQSVAAASMPPSTVDTSGAARAETMRFDSVDGERCEIVMAGDGEGGFTEDAKAGDTDCAPHADPVPPADPSP